MLSDLFFQDLGYDVPSHIPLTADLRSGAKTNQRVCRRKYPRAKDKSRRSKSCCEWCNPPRNQARLWNRSDARWHVNDEKDYDDGAWETDTIYSFGKELLRDKVGRVTWENKELMQRGRLAAWGLLPQDCWDGEVDLEEVEGEVCKISWDEDWDDDRLVVNWVLQGKKVETPSQKEVEVDGEMKAEVKYEEASGPESDGWSVVSGDEEYEFV